MRTFKRFGEPGYCYFVTTNTLNRAPHFARDDIAQIAVDNLLHYQSRGDYELHSFVVMPDHMHLLITPRIGTISDALRNLKSYICKDMRNKTGHRGPIWQVSFHDTIVRDDRHLYIVGTYIDYNPVVAGLCGEPEDYRFSSAGLEAGRRTVSGQGWGPNPRKRTIPSPGSPNTAGLRSAAPRCRRCCPGSRGRDRRGRGCRWR